MTASFSHLVLDSGPLIRGTIPSNLLSNLYTVPEVISEIKDVATRERLSKLPFTFATRSPTPEALRMVINFAKATGDYGTLSLTDLRVVALAVTLEMEVCGESSKMRKVPKPAILHEGRGAGKDKENKAQVVDKKSDEVIREEDGDEGEWITPENVSKFRGNGREWNSEEKSFPMASDPIQKVACITSDFAMQNVLLQMGLSLYTPDGIRVKQLKNWLLRCHACYATTKQMDRKFCPKCGNPTLIRTSYSVDAQGHVHLYLKKNFQYSTLR